jgi:ATP-binding cassette subfamily G (WHITE) protein 2
MRQIVPWHRQFRVLLDRALKEQQRRIGVFLTQMAQAVIIAVLIGTVFLQAGTHWR